MSKKILYTLFAVFLIIPIATMATNKKEQQFVEGKDYQRLNIILPISDNIPKGKSEVIEFFNYGCPWCFQLETTLQTWLAKKPSNVMFKRVPVAFEQGWTTYVKAYYAAKALDVLPKITPALFKAIHTQNLDLTSTQDMADFFKKQGISKEDFDTLFFSSPSIDIETHQANTLMRAYKIYQIPTFVIIGKETFKTNIAMVKGGEKKLLEVVSFLAKKNVK